MTKKKDYLQIKATAKYNSDSGCWVCSSKTPDITSGDFLDEDEAIDDYYSNLKEFLSEKYGITSSPSLYERTVKCKSASIGGIDEKGRTILYSDKANISISLIYHLTEQRNRTFAEFEEPKSVLEEALPGLQALGEKEGFTVSLHKGVESTEGEVC